MEDELKNTEPECVEKTPVMLAEEKAAEMEAHWKRALADYANLQKDVARQREEMGGFAVLRAVERFLPLLDYVKQAVATKPQSADKAVANWIVGIDHIARMFEESLRDLGLTTITTVGQKFDAARHEAVGEEDAEQEPGTVVKEVQAGYELNGRPVRPSKVIVAK